MILGELIHDHERVRNVTYESLWDNLGISERINSKAQKSLDFLLFSLLDNPKACQRLF